jgi:hypothetical protein
MLAFCCFGSKVAYKSVLQLKSPKELVQKYIQRPSVPPKI